MTLNEVGERRCARVVELAGWAPVDGASIGCLGVVL